MFATQALAALLALSAPLLALADVTPSEPGPGDVFRAGATCHITWLGDADSDTVWKNMAIELMTGSNLGMVHVTTVATDQDGTVDGRFEYPCPEMNPYSAIYFYQFSSPNTNVKTWTTRFTIASATGQTTPPANANQPGTTDGIPWGVGNLADPSAATPPPSFAGAAPPTTGATTGATTAVPSATVAPPTIRPTLSTTPRLISTPAAATTSASPSPTSQSTVKTDGAASLAAFDVRIWSAVAGLLFTAFVW